MIKLIIMAKRKTGMSLEDFNRYWREKHGPLVMNTADFARHIRRYVQCHKTDLSNSGFFSASSEFDGVGELWFDDIESMERAFSEPEYLNVIRPDELNFVDLEGCRLIITEEVPQYAPEGSVVSC
jgi:uncharacterized protein (TIGR02118 family)